MLLLLLLLPGIDTRLTELQQLLLHPCTSHHTVQAAIASIHQIKTFQNQLFFLKMNQRPRTPQPPQKNKQNKTKPKKKKRDKNKNQMEKSREESKLLKTQNFFTRKKIQPNWRNQEKKPNYPKPKTFSRDFTRRRRRSSRRKDENEEGRSRTRRWVLLVLQGNKEGDVLITDYDGPTGH